MSRPRIIRAPREREPAPPPRATTTAHVVRHAEQQAYLRAEARVEQAEREAAALIDDAREEATRLERQAHERGRKAATSQLLEAREQIRSHLAASERALTELAVSIAERLIDRELTLSPEAIGEVVARALERARGAERAVVRINPLDRPALEALLADLDRADITLTVDEGIRRGGCVVETAAGEVDGRLEHQLDAIRQVLCDDQRLGDGRERG